MRWIRILVLVLMLMLMTVHVVDKRSRVVILHKKWFMSKDTYWKDEWTDVR
jgi:hypothetical protein